MDTFRVGKRSGKFIHWEPIFIGTKSDPLYDERLSWDGRSDKMSQVQEHTELKYYELDSDPCPKMQEKCH